MALISRLSLSKIYCLRYGSSLEELQQMKWELCILNIMCRRFVCLERNLVTDTRTHARTYGHTHMRTHALLYSFLCWFYRKRNTVVRVTGSKDFLGLNITDSSWYEKALKNHPLLKYHFPWTENITLTSKARKKKRFLRIVSNTFELISHQPEFLFCRPCETAWTCHINLQRKSFHNTSYSLQPVIKRQW